ncbi:hypothetical protein FRC00_007188 [Tulasnella sp. 408]|nr:hypothetical protein FRC00_007188 [Tulasnella sp. 408]
MPFADSWLSPASGIYDDHCLLEAHTHKDSYLHIDNIQNHQLMLYSHPFSHTYLHHDTIVYSTYISTIKGFTLWYLLEWIKSDLGPSDWFTRDQNLACGKFFSLEFSARPPWIQGEGTQSTIDADLYKKHLAGWDKKYRVAKWIVVEMPPETTLQAWTALAGSALTELGARMDNLCNNIANDVHGAAQQADVKTMSKSSFGFAPAALNKSGLRLGKADVT